MESNPFLDLKYEFGWIENFHFNLFSFAEIAVGYVGEYVYECGSMARCKSVSIYVCVEECERILISIKRLL